MYVRRRKYLEGSRGNYRFPLKYGRGVFFLGGEKDDG